MNRIHKLAFALFGKYVNEKKEGYADLGLTIRQAHICLPWDIYASAAYLLAAVTGILGAVSGFLLMPLWRFLYMNYLRIAPSTGLGMSNYGETIFIIVIVFFFSLSLGLFTYYAILAYPRLAAYNRKSKIDLTLAHTVAYMHALSKGNISLISIFKSLSEHINVYGEAAEEIAFIVLDTELHGRDLNTALKKAAVTTNSDKFRDFLDNLINIIETGGDLETFFANTVSHYQKTAEAEQAMYLEVLGMLAETYVTVFVAGPLFLITILIVMGIMGPGSLLTIKVIVYAVIPLCSAAFSVLLSMISIGSETRLVKIYTVSKNVRHYDDLRLKPFTWDDERMIRKLMRTLRWTSVVEARKNPLKLFFADPNKALYLSVPAAFIYFILSIYKQEITIDLLDDAIIISTLISLVPFLFFYEMQMKRIKEIGESVPGFLKRLATVTDMGMPLTAAIKSISKISLGVLSTEVKLIHKHIVWTHSVVEALMKFERRVNTVAISRIVTLIAKASESTGNIKETLRVAARDADLAEKLRHQKFAALFSYLIVVYISFAVFMMVLYVFATMFLPRIPSTSGASGMLSISAHKAEYSMLFMHASVIQGFFSGVIAGQMMGENFEDGLKHSVVMMTVAYIFFVWFM
jgi:flagellar protein FlaJ